MRQERLREGRIEAIYEGLDPDLPHVAIKAHPLNVLDDLKVARAVYKAVCRLPDASEEDARRVEVEYGAVVLDLAAIEVIKLVDDHAGREPGEREVQSRAEALLERLPSVPEASLDDVDLTLRRLKSLVGWLAREASMPPDVGTVDGSVDPPEDRLLERVRTTARLDVVLCEREAEEVEAQILKERRRRVLPSEADLQMIARYEAHLGRQMYQALHELKALQARRRGGAALLARVDVKS